MRSGSVSEFSDKRGGDFGPIFGVAESSKGNERSQHGDAIASEWWWSEVSL